METTDANHINQNLIASILENESLNDNNVRIALDEIGRRIIFHPSSHPEDKVYHFNIITGKNYDGNSVEISIQVLKGSLMTHTWNTFSRFDDEYLWKYKNTDGIVCDILYIAGLNQSECSVKKGSCNWVKFREIMIYMDIASVGLCMFVTLLGHLLFTIPHFTQEGTYIVPMPATYM